LIVIKTALQLPVSERGLATLEKTGNTNQVSLASWLKQ
jgi:hypothetical protein